MHGLVSTTSREDYAVRRIGAFNRIGVWTLYTKEVKRFVKVGMQTIAAPVATTLLFMAIFLIALSGTGRGIGSVPFKAFLAPGLIMMALLQNSFANTTSSLMGSKVQGNIVDVLMPPLSAGELTFAYTMGGVTRGLMVAIVLAIPLHFFVGFKIYNIALVIYYAVAGSMLLSLMGVAAAIWAEKFDHLATVTNFVIQPLTFLSGTFYSITRLPKIWQHVNVVNPFFYMIDGFRYGFIGHADSNVGFGVIFTAGCVAALWTLCHQMFKRGYKIKA
ncbi:MAG TPA: ABC transporter permease [Alphaproteobacteria bacterium]|nr:ABC transporter permease [Alphaproteobacteria bacterium]